jgi:glycyl-tRNA synthetase
MCVCFQGDESRAVFKFTPLIAPVKCTVFPLLQKQQLSDQAALINKELTAAGLSNIIDTTGE